MQHLQEREHVRLESEPAHFAGGDHPFRRIAITDIASWRSERSDVSLWGSCQVVCSFVLDAG